MPTVEDTLTTDLVAYWTANRPTGLPAGWGIYHHQSTGAREKPCLIIGHEGAQRVPSMPDTKRVALRVMALSDLDVTDPATHRTVAGAIDDAIAALPLRTNPGPLTNTYLHDLLAESPDKAIVESDGRREEYTVLKRTAVVSRYTE